MRLGEGDTAGLSASDVSIAAVRIDLSTDPKKANLIQVTYEGIHLERGVGGAGYNLMVRHEAVGGSNAGCQWTYMENAYEPITVSPVDSSAASSSFRPMASAMEIACGPGQGGFKATGNHARGHVVTDRYVDIMLHRRIPSTPSPDLYRQFTKGDDSSTVSTSIWYDFGLAPGASGEEHGGMD